MEAFLKADWKQAEGRKPFGKWKQKAFARSALPNRKTEKPIRTGKP